MLKKGLWALVLLAFLGTARCYNADMASALGGLPIVGAIVQPPQPTPAYVKSIGTPAPAALPETDFATWFPAEAPADPYDTKVWSAVAQYATAGGTREGWTEVCKKVGGAAGGERSANPKLGALACSKDATVTQVQQFALELLGTQAAVALWIKGELNGSVSAIQGRQAELRVSCGTGVVARQGGADSPWPAICEQALDASYLGGDGPATFNALAAAYEAAANAIAAMDPEPAPEPAFFGTAKP